MAVVGIVVVSAICVGKGPSEEAAFVVKGVEDGGGQHERVTALSPLSALVRVYPIRPAL
jgi:hypothetical protein